MLSDIGNALILPANETLTQKVAELDAAIAGLFPRTQYRQSSLPPSKRSNLPGLAGRMYLCFCLVRLKPLPSVPLWQLIPTDADKI